MSEITTKITKLPKVAGRFSTDFIKTADKFLNQLPNTYTQLNSFAGETNKVRDEVNDLRDAAKSYRDEAYNKAEEAKAVVIPDEATYSKDEIELRSLTMGQAQFEALAEERRKKYAGSGKVEKSPDSRDDQTRFINDDLWATLHSILGNDDYNNFLMPQNQKYNVNGTILNLNSVATPQDSIMWNNTTHFYNSNLITLPNSPTAFNVTDSTKLPQAMTQGDFAVLADLDRELVTNGTFDSNINGWHASDHLDISIDNGRLKVVAKEDSDFEQVTSNNYETIKNIMYKYSVDYDDNGTGIPIEVVPNDNCNYHDSIKVFTSKGSNFKGIIFILRKIKKDDTVYFDNVSVKQVEEQPIVALSDIDSDTDVYANVGKFEGRDSVSRQDLVFLESWHEKISDKDIVYPFGNVQYRGSDVNGLTGIDDGDFEGADTYSRFGVWQSAGDLVGKGYVWSKLTLEEKKALASNPEHNIYVDENGEFIQVRYKITVEKGNGNFDSETTMEKLGYQQVGLGLFYNKILNRNAILIANIQRRNQGIYHPTYNPEGTALIVYDSDGNGLQMLKWYEVPDSANNSLQDCFDPSKIAIYKLDDDGNVVVDSLNNQDGTYMLTGLIKSKVSGRPDGIYADEINERDVQDLRMNAHKKPFKEILDEMNNKAITGDIRGKEGLPFIKPGTNPNDLFKRWCKDNGSLEDQFIEKSFTCNNAITWTDIIGDPRKLQDRIQYTVGDDEQIDVSKNEYILCNDSTHNSGTKGHLYRNLGDSLSNIHTNDDSQGDANKDGGHIDFSDTNVWLDLGSDLTIGAYNQVWLDKGFNGTPLVLGENGENILPIFVGDTNSYIEVKLAKKLTNDNKILVSKKDGTFVEYTKGDATKEKKYSLDNVKNTIKININSSYNDLGYGSVQEMLDLIKVIVTYETKANNMELANNVSCLEKPNRLEYLCNRHTNIGCLLVSNLINKVPVGDDSDYHTYIEYNPNLGFSDYQNIFNHFRGILAKPVNRALDPYADKFKSNPAVKVLSYLIQRDNRAYLQVIFKELKYDSDVNNIGDDDKFQIVDKVSTVTDNNGNTVLIGQKRIPTNYFIKED